MALHSIKTLVRGLTLAACCLPGTWSAANAAPAPAGPNASEIIAETRTYKQIGERALKLFIEKPADWKAADRRPGIVFFFGGGWVGGTPEQFRRQSEHLASRGMVGIRVEYRTLAKGDSGPPLVCCADAKSALRYVRAHAGELGIDPDRIAAAGGSAGGHLAAFTALVPGLDSPADDLAVSCKPNALVLFNPVFNNAPGQWGHQRVGDRYREFSPAHHISPDAPPTIVFLGDRDRLIPVSVLREFEAGMKKAGVRCEARVYSNAGHGFFNRDTPQGAWFTETLKETERFLASLGWLQAAPEVKAPSRAGVIPESLPQAFANPPQRYWPRPLWFWNNTPVTVETVREQMRLARERCRYGGFGILPFGRKFAPAYLGDEYFTVYGAALDEAKALGLTLSLYDEYGFPSGSAGSQNSSDTSLFAQRWPAMTIKRLDKHEWEVRGPALFQTNVPPGQLCALVAMNTDTLERVELSDGVEAGRFEWAAPAGSWKIMAFVCVKDGDPICDYLDPEAADRFIELTHQAYYDRFAAHFGATIDSTFFDEPTLYRAQGRTWTEQYNRKFTARHGFDPRPFYPALWYDIGPETSAARNYLFGFRAELYAIGFTKRIQDWCTAHGIAATGHQDQEEVVNPVSVSGDLMKCFQHLDIPGIDKIGGDRPAERFYKVISSAAYNWDKALVMSETYGAMGDLPWEAIYSVAMEQYTKGINLLIPHAVWYDTTQVTFKPELSWRHPRYAERLPEFNTYLARLNLLLQNDAAHVADIAVLYPIATLQGSHHLDGPLGFYQGGVTVPEADYVDVGELLAVELGRDYTFLHPEVLDAQCRIEAGRLLLPNRVHPGRFSVLILPGHQTIHWSSLRKIQSFHDQGGCVIATGRLPSKSAEFGHDRDVERVIQAMFGTTDAGSAGESLVVRRNDRGGCAIALRTLDSKSLQAALDAARPDYDVSFELGRALRYIHKVWNGRHLYFFANLNPRLAETTVTLRGRHELQAWDPHTGAVSPIEGQHTSRNGTDFTGIRLKLPHLRSVFLMGRGGTRDEGRAH